MEIKNGNFTVYIHINKINNKMYVGITSRKPEERWQRDGNGYKRNKHFYAAIEKYGWDNFEHEIFASNLTEDEACNIEKILIDKLNTTDPKYGYNVEKGGTNICTNYKAWNDVHKSEEYREKLRKAKIGKKQNAESNLKRSETLKKYTKTDEYRKHLSESLKGKPKKSDSESCLAKKIICIETSEIFGSALEASRHCHVCFSSVCRAARTGCRSAGFHWAYLENISKTLTTISKESNAQAIGA